MSQVVRGKVNVVSYISSFDVNDESDVGNTDFKWWFSFATFLIELEFEDADFLIRGSNRSTWLFGTRTNAHSTTNSTHI